MRRTLSSASARCHVPLPCAEANFRRFSFIDYGRWLPRYDLVIHHGGAGIIHYCIADAKPAVVYPLDYDQFDHAARLVRAGLALRLRRPRDLKITVQRALNDLEMRRRCEEFRTICARMVAANPLLEVQRVHFAAAPL